MAFYVTSIQQSVMQAIVEIKDEWKSEVEYDAWYFVISLVISFRR